MSYFSQIFLTISNNLPIISPHVSLAQPVEHFPFKEVAVGSNPTRDTSFNVTNQKTLSSSGQGHYHFMVITGVQIP